MGVPITSRKRKMLLTAAAAIFTIFVVFMTTSQTVKTSSGIVIPDTSKDSDLGAVFSEDALSVQVPGSAAKGAAASEKSVQGGKADTQIATKKLNNGNNLVKSKEGQIDESKVREAETSNGSKKIPLTAGDPTSKNAHEKASLEDQKQGGNDADKTGSGLSKSAPNGIKADKGLAAVEQKEKAGSDGGKKKSASGSDSKQGAKKSLNDQVMKAQEKAQTEGVSKDVGSSFNPQTEFKSILSKSPVVIFSKSYCPFSKKLKHLLKTEYHISPEPLVIELDDHENGKELQQHIGEETGRFTVPNLIIDGKSRGGADDILALHDNDELVDVFHSWTSGAAKMKKLTTK